MNKSVRAACVVRSEGKCEACSRWAGEALRCDHFFGRARSEEVSTCWMLCPKCDEAKTQNRPAAATWLKKFLEHTAKHHFHAAYATAFKRLQFVQQRNDFNKDTTIYGDGGVA